MRHRNDAPLIGAAGRKPSRRRRGLAALSAVTLGTGLVSVGATFTTPASVAASEAEPAEVLHYRMRSSYPATQMNPADDYEQTTDVWQAGDGSRLRALVESSPSLAGVERVLTRSESRVYIPHDNRIIVRRGSTWLPAPAGYDLSAQIGDPRTLPGRAQDRDSGVKALGEATVNGVAVLRYGVGTCEVTSPSPNVYTRTRVSVVSIRRDTRAPVRVDQPPCSEDDNLPWPSFDYLQFESLPASEDNLRQLEMSPHPGAAEVDGDALDAAEESTGPPRRVRPVTNSGRAARKGKRRAGRRDRSRARRAHRSAR